jgi:hypothetical protein
VVDTSGFVYGTTQHDGLFGAGVLYGIGPNSYAELHNFQAPPSHDDPLAAILFDPAGTMYGIAGWSIERKVPGVDLVVRAPIPSSTYEGNRLTRAFDGTLFGTTIRGDCDDTPFNGPGIDSLGEGALIRLRPGAAAVDCLSGFGIDGQSYGDATGLYAETANLVYGVQSRRIFAWTPGTGIVTLIKFDGYVLTSGVARLGRFAYGFTSDPAHGALYRFDLYTQAFTILHVFNGTTEGDGPGLTPIIQGSYLYGVTGGGGAFGGGTIFRYRLW